MPPPVSHVCTFPDCGKVMPWTQERCPSCGHRTYLRLRELNREAKEHPRPSSQTAVLVPVEADAPCP